MEQRLKQRLVGAAVLAALAVIFLPMIYDEPVVSPGDPRIPPRPKEITGPQFAPLTEAEIMRGARLPDTPVPAADTSAAAPMVPPPPAAADPDRGQPAETPVVRPPPAAPTPVPPAKRPDSPKKPASPARARTPPGNERVGIDAWAIQLGSFSSEANAKALRDRLQRLGFKAFVERIYVKTEGVFRVRVGPEMARHKALALRAEIEQQVNLSGILVRYP